MDTVKQLRDKIAAGQVKSIDAVMATFERIDKHEPAVGAYLSINKEQAMEQAKEIDEKIAAGQSLGPLAGVPIAIKDNMCTTFGTTTCGSKILENFQAP